MTTIRNSIKLVLVIWTLAFRIYLGFGIWKLGFQLQSLISMTDFSFKVLIYCLNAFSISLSK
jgi:hypothetical protein